MNGMHAVNGMGNLDCSIWKLKLDRKRYRSCLIYCLKKSGQYHMYECALVVCPQGPRDNLCMFHPFLFLYGEQCIIYSVYMIHSV